MKHVSMVGLGYIGLPTALVAASNGYQVSGFDIDEQKVNLINNGVCPIEEPDIEDLLHETLRTKTFHAYTKLQPADYFVIAVPTPFKEDKQADLSYVFAAAKLIAKVIQTSNTVILESTVPVGTTQKLAQILEKESGLKQGIDFYVSHCPERVLPGKIIHELQNNDRIIGGMSKRACELSKQFYEKFVFGTCYLTDDKTAEMIKLIENSSRDIQIALANQIAGMCKQAEINPFNVIALANKHPRVNILQPGCGVGGHCIAVDPWFLIEQFPEHTRLLQSARNINNSKPHAVIQEVLSAVQNFLESHKRIPKVLALGLTFKPNIDDLRESPALEIATELKQHHKILQLSVCEPHIKKEKLNKLGFNNIISLNEGLAQTDIVVILVKHDTFKTITHMQLTNKIVIDPCGMMKDEKNETTLSRKGNRQTTFSSNSIS